MAPDTATDDSAESRLGQLIERLLTGANGALAGAEYDTAREMAADVLTVDPENERAAEVISLADAGQRSHLGERAVMTILFSDLVDSTPLADLEEPEIVRDVFAAYRDEAKRAVELFGGRIINYLGDGIVAGFGLPLPHEDDAHRAVNAGLELVSGMREVAERVQREHGVEPRVRVGIHTGLVVIADIGSGAATERDAIVGVTPNLAARIQAEAGVDQVVISDVTEHIVQSEFSFESLGAHSLKGIGREVELFHVLGTRDMSARLASARFVSVPTLGREAITASLEARWRSVSSDGEAPPTLLVGQPGLGKSRTVADFRKMVEATGGTSFDIGCLPYYTNSPLWPVGQALLRYLDIAGDDLPPVRLSALEQRLDELGSDRATSVPLLGPLIGVGPSERYPPPELDPGALRQATLTALVTMLGGRDEDRPRAIVVEDVHWADPSTLDLLGMCAAQASSQVMLLMTSPHQLESPWADVVDVHELNHLDDEAAHRLIAALVGDATIPDATRDSIVSRAGGVPLYIEELTRGALSAGSDDFPVRLQELLAARLKAPGVDLELAQTAATLGVEFDPDVLGSVVGDPADMEARLRGLEDAEIVDKVGDSTGRRYRFRHALLRDAAYETQVLDMRRDWHGQIAGVLAEQGGDAAVIAGHLDMAGKLIEAVTQYGAAAQQAQSSGAHAEATQLTSRALELAAGMPEGPDRSFVELGMLMLRGLSQSSVSGYAAPEVGADFRQAAQLSEKLGNPPAVMPAAIAIWSFSLVSGDVPTARLLTERLQARVADGSGAAFAPEVAAVEGYQALYEGDLPAAAAALQRADTGLSSRPPGEMVTEHWSLPNDPLAVTLIGKAVVATLAGEMATAAAAGAAAIQRAEAVPFPAGPFSTAFVKVYLAWLARVLGRRDETHRLGAEILEIAQRHGYAYWMALGSIYHEATGHDPATYAAALASLKLIGHEAFRGANVAHLAELQLAAGDVAGAIETVHDGLLDIAKSGELLHRPYLLRLRGRLTLATGGSAADATADIEKSLELAVAQRNAVYGLQAALEIAGLTPETRRGDWRDVLESQASLFAATDDFEALARARSVLAAP